MNGISFQKTTGKRINRITKLFHTLPFLSFTKSKHLTFVDTLLQRWRIRKASRFIPANCTLLDIGCHHGELLNQMQPHIHTGVGIDPLCVAVPAFSNIQFIQGTFPQDLPSNTHFDAIVALAVVEHIPAESLPTFFEACFQCLTPNGVLICTIPHPRVDHILAVLRALKLIAGMNLEEHHGYDVKQTIPLAAAAGLQLKHLHRFQAGLNFLFVFAKPCS